MRRADRLAAAEQRRATRYGGLLLLVALIVALALADYGDLPRDDGDVLVPVEMVP